MQDTAEIVAKIDTTRASAARIYDYLLGGHHNFQVDREVAEKLKADIPSAEIAARSNRAFLRRVVQFLTSQGIEQFIDLGSGLPTAGNVHEIAQKTNQNCKVVYVDNEPVAASQSRLILEGNPTTVAILGDMREPETILHHPDVHSIIDFTRPVGLLMMAVLHFVSDEDKPVELVQRYRDALVSGSFLGLSHGTADRPDTGITDAPETYKKTQNQLYLRTHAETASFFAGLELVEPGIVYTPLWRPEDEADVPKNVTKALAYGGVGRKL